MERKLYSMVMALTIIIVFLSACIGGHSEGGFPPHLPPH